MAIAIAGLAVSTVALVLVMRDDDGPPGRKFVVRSVSQYALDEPVLFEEDDFYLVRLADPESGTTLLRALYRVVPHVYFGLEEGCRVTWRPDQSYEKGGKTYTGIYTEGCGGSTFAVDGTRLFGPRARDLDQFNVYVLHCSAPRRAISISLTCTYCTAATRRSSIRASCSATNAQEQRARARSHLARSLAPIGYFRMGHRRPIGESRPSC